MFVGVLWIVLRYERKRLDEEEALRKRKPAVLRDRPAENLRRD